MVESGLGQTPTPICFTRGVQCIEERASARERENVLPGGPAMRTAGFDRKLRTEDLRLWTGDKGHPPSSRHADRWSARIRLLAVLSRVERGGQRRLGTVHSLQEK